MTDPEPGPLPPQTARLLEREAGRREIVTGVLLWLAWIVGTGLLFAIVGAAVGLPGEMPEGAAEDPADDPDARRLLVWAIATQSLVSVVVIAAMRRFPPSAGFARVRGDLRLVGLGYPVFFIAWTAFVALVHHPIWTGLGLEAATQPQLAVLRGADPASLAVLVVAIVVVAPLFEELVFRGYLLGGLRRVHGERHALFWSSLAFGLVHATSGLYPVLPLCLIGAFLGWLRLRTGSLVTPVLAHVAHNGLTIVLALTAPELAP